MRPPYSVGPWFVYTITVSKRVRTKRQTRVCSDTSTLFISTGPSTVDHGGVVGPKIQRVRFGTFRRSVVFARRNRYPRRSFCSRVLTLPRNTISFTGRTKTGIVSPTRDVCEFVRTFNRFSFIKCQRDFRCGSTVAERAFLRRLTDDAVTFAAGRRNPYARRVRPGFNAGSPAGYENRAPPIVHIFQIEKLYFTRA